MPNYQMMKAKYSVHSKLYKKCLDYYEQNLVLINEIEQILATGRNDDGSKAPIPADLMSLLKNPDVLYTIILFISHYFRPTDKLRLLMLLYASNPDQLKNRAQIELGTIDKSMQVALDEWACLCVNTTRQVRIYSALSYSYY